MVVEPGRGAAGANRSNKGEPSRGVKRTRAVRATAVTIDPRRVVRR